MLKFGRVTRENMVKELTALFKQNNAVIIVNFQNIDVNKMQQLKRPLRPSSTKFTIVKNSIARIAARNVHLESIAPLFEGTCAVGFCNQDMFFNASKVLVNFSKENENFKILGGSIEGEFVSCDRIKQMAMLPPREVLLAMAVGGIKSPISGFVGVLNNMVGGFVRVIEQVSRKKQ